MILMCIVGLPSVLKVAYCELQNTFTVTTYLFKVPEVPERHVPEERKPIPVPKKEAPPAKGISSALVNKTTKQTKMKTPKTGSKQNIFCYIIFLFSWICLWFYSLCGFGFALSPLSPYFHFFICAITYITACICLSFGPSLS